MAEIEYKGIKLGGSKLVIIIPLLGTLIGGLWGGFELYNRLLIAEKKLSTLNPAQIEMKMEELTRITDIIREDLKDEIDMALDLAREVDQTSASTQREVRNDVYEMEKEMQSRFREMDADIRTTKKELEEKITTILENPLNDTE
jgi:gas vesicle protein|tara:strand:- start:1148 stop:1579 length:432 start_codon:yes stop_codon:yes gene_type:complete